MTELKLTSIPISRLKNRRNPLYLKVLFFVICFTCCEKYIFPAFVYIY